MTLIIVFFVIAFLLFGYYIMDRIDKFIESNFLIPDEYHPYQYLSDNEDKEIVILIYGDNALSKHVKNYCDSQKYLYENIIDIHYISKDYRYMYLLALSLNDVDNLMVSSIGLKVYGIPHIIILCNNKNNLKIYREFNFDKVLLYTDEIDKLLNIMKETIENAVKKEI
ncbi:hypothetical protein NSA47_05665 [Irregularibacter muris]|uniref:Uncharacterized protein n=1 Tax=Irregularibacter muris TaxID=1796619 RepID=A0AAE3HFC8_9FIRM|nr:hypothetical protein [Irregularibacter muris]MCR1898477.1 hypothetical protein [Irregularibacter muris]